MSEQRMPIRVSDITMHDATVVTVQRDLEHGSLDLVIKGTDKYRTTRMTIYGAYKDDSSDTEAPELQVLPDREPEPDEDDDESEGE